MPVKLTKDNWPDFLPVIREQVRFYLIANKVALRRFQSLACGVAESDEWSADVINNGVIPRVEDALKSLAKKRW